jgi:hypothetical protein
MGMPIVLVMVAVFFCPYSFVRLSECYRPVRLCAYGRRLRVRRFVGVGDRCLGVGDAGGGGEAWRKAVDCRDGIACYYEVQIEARRVVVAERRGAVDQLSRLQIFTEAWTN